MVKTPNEKYNKNGLFKKKHFLITFELFFTFNGENEGKWKENTLKHENNIFFLKLAIFIDRVVCI